MDDNRSRRSPKEEDNPFSFVSFLKQQTEYEDAPYQQIKEEPDCDQNIGASDNNSNPYSFSNIVKLKSDNMLPKLPTLSTDSEDECNIFPTRNVDNNPESVITRRPLLIIEDPPVDLQLPQPEDLDFSSINEAFGTQVFSDEDTLDSVLTEEVQDDHLRNKFIASQEEIAKLHEQLESNKRKALQKDLRIQELEFELKKVKDREADETATLERMMHSIEKNLKLTTERAVLAETQVSSLKHELKSSQAKVASLEAQLTSTLPEKEVSVKAQTIAHKLNMAANQAETSLKDLLDGVGQLRLLSSVVGSITKVTEAS